MLFRSTASANFSNEGITTFAAGDVGNSGGLPAGGIGNTKAIQNISTIVTSGSGGGGAGTANGNGGNVTGYGDVPTILGGTSTTPNGGTGFFRIFPFYSIGGAGGFGNTSGQGGNGGDGAYGSGGGGGGAGITGGSGGQGGDGLVIISCW